MLLADDYKGDFLGFTFNGKHSGDFKIIRISGGNRFDKILLPVQKDNIIDIPGADGSYFFNSTFDPLIFNISFAFIDISESNLRELMNWLGTKETHSLIFDEYPYKEYQAKIQGSPQFNFIPFDVDGQRVYKGEGNVQFQVYWPYATAPYKTLAEYNDSNKDEWSAASKILSSRTNYDKISNSNIAVYNPGDISSPLIVLGISLKSATTGYIDLKYQITKTGTTTTKQRLVLDMFKMPVGTYLQINSKLKLIQALSGATGVSTGAIYNNIIAAGDFISIEPQEDSETHKITITNTESINVAQVNGFHVDYDYIYR